MATPKAAGSGGLGFTVFQVPGARTSASVNGGARTAPSMATSSVSSGDSFTDNNTTGGFVRTNRLSSASYSLPPTSMHSQSSQSQQPSLRYTPGAALHSMNDNTSSPGGIDWMRTGRVIRVKDTGESFRFPLEPDYLPRIQLTDAQFAEWKSKLSQLAQAAIKNPYTWKENPTTAPDLRKFSWKTHLEKKTCVIYRRRNTDTRDAQVRNVMVRAKLDSTLEEMTAALVCDTTEDFRATLAHMHQDGFLDAAVLQVHERPTVEDPAQFLGVKWKAFQSSVDSVFAVRDMLIVEFAKTFTDANGQPVLARVTQSINMKDYNGFERNFGFLRSSVTYVHLVTSMGPSSGKVDVSLRSDMVFVGGKNTPSWLANRIVTNLYPMLENTATAADARFVMRSRMISEKAWVPNNERPACSVCFKSFNLLRSRHHCRACAEIMCTPCTVELGILTAKLPPNMRPESNTGFIVSVEKFCLKCINKGRQERRDGGHINSSNSLSAASSSNQEEYAAAAYRMEGDSADAAFHYSAYGDRPSEVGYYQSDNRGSQSEYPQNVSFVSQSSSSGSAGSHNGEKSAITYAGWSSKVLSTMNRDKPIGTASGEYNLSTTSTATSSLRHVNPSERSRQNSDASSTTSMGSQSMGSLSDRDSNPLRGLRREPRDKEHDESIVLFEEDDVQEIAPLPKTFTKLEESIAAQQALLRSMFIEGQKIMQQQQQYQHNVQQPQYNQQYIGVDEPRTRLALPPSSTE